MSHVFATPCNNFPECFDGRDEKDCQLPPWVVSTTLSSGVILLSLGLFIYLVKNLKIHYREIAKKFLPTTKMASGGCLYEKRHSI